MKRNIYLLAGILLILSFISPNASQQGGLTSGDTSFFSAGIGAAESSSDSDQLGDYFNRLYKKSSSPSQTSAKDVPLKQKEIKKKVTLKNNVLNLWKKPKKKENKNVAPANTASLSLNTNLTSSLVQSMTLGPGPERESFLVKTNGAGTLTAILEWTGPVSLLRIDVFPEETPEKMNNNATGMRESKTFLASLLALSNAAPDTDIQNPEAINDSSEFAASVTGKEGGSPLLHEVTLNVSQWKNLRVEVVKKSDTGIANATLTFSGTGQITEIKKPQITLPQQNSIASILTPVVMYELDRKAQAQSPNVSATYAGSYSKFLQKMTDLTVNLGVPSFYNSQVIDILSSAGGGQLSSQKIKQIKTLLDANVPPKAPINLVANSAALSTGTVGTARLSWSIPKDGGTQFKIEYAIRPANLMNVNQLQFQEGGQLNWTGTNAIYTLGLPVPAHQACYRVRAFNQYGTSGYSNVTCLNYELPTTQVMYNLKWMKLKAVSESTWDNWSDSDEPYLIFVMANGKKSDGSLNVWSTRWMGADDVDSGETEPDGGGMAQWTLFGKPISGSPTAAQPTYIDSNYGLLAAAFLFESDTGLPEFYEMFLRDLIKTSGDVLDAYMKYDAGQVQYILSGAVEAMFDLMAFGGAPVDNFLGAKAHMFNVGDAWQAAGSNDAHTELLYFNAGNQGIYKANLCLFAAATNISAINTRCNYDL